MHGALRVVAANAPAQSVGIGPGMPLADANALFPGLAVEPHDARGEAKTLQELSVACSRYTPWAAVDADGGLRAGQTDGSAGIWLDVTGCDHLFGGEQILLDDLIRRVSKAGYHARAAIADTPGAAWALARYGRFERGRNSLIAPSGAHRDALIPLPAAALRLDNTALAHLDHVGLRRIGDFVDMPRAPLTARFGETVVTRLDQALGFLEEPISPNRTEVHYHSRLAFAEPIGRIEDVALVLEKLLETLCGRFKDGNLGARRLEFILYRVDNTLAKAVIGTSRPSRDPLHLARLFRDKLDGLYLGFGVEVAALIATATAPQEATQPDLDGQNADIREDAAQLVDRLSGRFGVRNVARLKPVSTYIPERAGYEVAAAKSLALKQKPDVWREDETRPQPRPLQLLSQPMPIDVMAPVPDGPPVMFRWRKRQHRIAGASGPERIAPEWWRLEGQPLTPEIRDYYRIEDQDGRRFWVYREGLYRPDKLPRWYLHGFFA